MSSEGYKIISGVQFGLLDPDTIRKLSAERIITPDTYDADGSPIDSGLMDGKLGTIDPGQRCKTCGARIGSCPGHFGHIELSRPVIHVGFNKLIYKILRASCRNPECHRILLDPSEIAEAREKLAEYREQWGEEDYELIEELMKRAAKKNVCPYCGEKQHKIRLEKPTTYFEEVEIENGQKQLNKLSPTDIHSWFKGLSDEDCELFGINPKYARPEWMILEVLPVPPVSVRPSITLENGIRSEDDLTHKLVDIIRINQRLLENREAGAPQLIVEDLWELLQYHVSTYFDNEISGIPPARHRSGRALRTLTQRLKGKEGRFRSNLSGKRVDFSARTVISPDPLLSINEVGVPKDIAEILTVPQRVTEWNIEEMKELVLKGPKSFPGANYIIRPDGRRVDLRYARNLQAAADSIKPEFIIERHLRDGDIVLFNRQPSLHRMSIMAHEVKVVPYKTFRLTLPVCRPYNADFDGDEMNLHVPQSEEAQAEARILMRVQEQISTPRYGGPIIGAIQDFITSAYFLTRKDAKYTRSEVSQLITAAGLEKLPKPDLKSEDGKDLWSGKALFSALLPEDFNFTMKNKLCEEHETCMKQKCPNEAYIFIKNGQLKSGIIDKKAFGAEVPDSVLHRILKEYGADITRKFLDNVTRLLITNITLRGFSMSASNVDIPAKAEKQIEKILKKAKEEVNKLIEQYKNGTLERQPGRTEEETLEAKIMETLSKARDDSSKVSSQYLDPDNEALIMAKTGARGNMLNLGQMSACVGQQAVRGQRIVRGYRNRVLPFFKKDDLSAEAHGFVDSSFRKGLNPIEFFMHACGGREGLVDTAVRTSQSGYMQRRLVNALQDISSCYDNTVRNATGEIVQFTYGEDNVDPAKSDHGKAVNVKLIVNKILETFSEEGEE
ncbi:MAG: DNA-directed RNA polymerase subunit A' [Candidatus Heimdallarchaeum aukensis]|uniref:DNA-directed RNA polymerase subunit Rpo1N n=1 Tax=Candidatus Heimdallarchaeum aukensis TaxID=2876573 RepID=A0A9Y1BJB2_9ARCH|nr:MAG: DNA-directed RNA polymerase subunit A' [Candidatus Heimdallarchaeum aukensis]